MARVSQAHLDARRRHILGAARRCFVRNGFHATSMADLLAEAEMSAGGLYRYFSSKDDIVRTIAADALQGVTKTVEAITSAASLPPLEDALRQLGGDGSPLCADPDSARLLVQIWAEAVRSKNIRERFREAFAGGERVFADLVGEYQRRGQIPADVDQAQAARLLIGMVYGFVVQRALLPDARPETFQPGLAGAIFGGTA
jgi:AcrR family transcriptional regulator